MVSEAEERGCVDGADPYTEAPYPLVQIQGALAVQERGGSEGEGMEGEIQTEMGEGQERERERETLVRTLQTPAAAWEVKAG